MSSETLTAHGLTAQSLSRGAAGIALLHIERALSGMEELAEQAEARHDDGAGLLMGEASIRLAMETIYTPPRSGWDSCLLIT